MIWVYGTSAQKRLYRAESAIKEYVCTSNMHKVINGCRGVSRCKNMGLVRFLYASSTSYTILLHWSRCCCSVVFLPRLRSHSTTSKTPKNFKLHFIYAYGDAGPKLMLRYYCTLASLLYTLEENPGFAALATSLRIRGIRE